MHGTRSEQDLLLPVITADAGYHSHTNLKALAEQHIHAYIPDNGYRKCDNKQLQRFTLRGKAKVAEP